MSTIDLGGETRELKLTINAIRIADKSIGGAGVLALVRSGEPIAFGTAIEIAAAAMLHDTPRASPTMVERLLEAEPHKMFDLMRAVSEALVEAFQRMTPQESAPLASSGPQSP